MHRGIMAVVIVVVVHGIWTRTRMCKGVVVVGMRKTARARCCCCIVRVCHQSLPEVDVIIVIMAHHQSLPKVGIVIVIIGTREMEGDGKGTLLSSSQHVAGHRPRWASSLSSSGQGRWREGDRA